MNFNPYGYASQAYKFVSDTIGHLQQSIAEAAAAEQNHTSTNRIPGAFPLNTGIQNTQGTAPSPEQNIQEPVAESVASPINIRRNSSYILSSEVKRLAKNRLSLPTYDLLGQINVDGSSFKLEIAEDSKILSDTFETNSLSDKKSTHSIQAPQPASIEGIDGDAHNSDQRNVSFENTSPEIEKPLNKAQTRQAKILEKENAKKQQYLDELQTIENSNDRGTQLLQALKKVKKVTSLPKNIRMECREKYEILNERIQFVIGLEQEIERIGAKEHGTIGIENRDTLISAKQLLINEKGHLYAEVAAALEQKMSTDGVTHWVPENARKRLQEKLNFHLTQLEQGAESVKETRHEGIVYFSMPQDEDNQYKRYRAMQKRGENPFNDALNKDISPIQAIKLADANGRGFQEKVWQQFSGKNFVIGQKERIREKQRDAFLAELNTASKLDSAPKMRDAFEKLEKHLALLKIGQLDSASKFTAKMRELNEFEVSIGQINAIKTDHKDTDAYKLLSEFTEILRKKEIEFPSSLLPQLKTLIQKKKAELISDFPRYCNSMFVQYAAADGDEKLNGAAKINLLKNDILSDLQKTYIDFSSYKNDATVREEFNVAQEKLSPELLAKLLPLPEGDDTDLDEPRSDSELFHFPFEFTDPLFDELHDTEKNSGIQNNNTQPSRVKGKEPINVNIAPTTKPVSEALNDDERARHKYLFGLISTYHEGDGVGPSNFADLEREFKVLDSRLMASMNSEIDEDFSITKSDLSTDDDETPLGTLLRNISKNKIQPENDQPTNTDVDPARIDVEEVTATLKRIVGKMAIDSALLQEPIRTNERKVITGGHDSLEKHKSMRASPVDTLSESNSSKSAQDAERGLHATLPLNVTLTGKDSARSATSSNNSTTGTPLKGGSLNSFWNFVSNIKPPSSLPPKPESVTVEPKPKPKQRLKMDDLTEEISNNLAQSSSQNVNSTNVNSTYPRTHASSDKLKSRWFSLSFSKQKSKQIEQPTILPHIRRDINDLTESMAEELSRMPFSTTGNKAVINEINSFTSEKDSLSDQLPVSEVIFSTSVFDEALSAPANATELFAMSRKNSAANNAQEQAQIFAAQQTVATSILAQLDKHKEQYVTTFAQQLVSGLSETERNGMLPEVTKAYVEKELREYDTRLPQMKSWLTNRIKTEFNSTRTLQDTTLAKHLTGEAKKKVTSLSNNFKQDIDKKIQLFLNPDHQEYEARKTHYDAHMEKMNVVLNSTEYDSRYVDFLNDMASQDALAAQPTSQQKASQQRMKIPRKTVDYFKDISLTLQQL